MTHLDKIKMTRVFFSKFKTKMTDTKIKATFDRATVVEGTGKNQGKLRLLGTINATDTYTGYVKTWVLRDGTKTDDSSKFSDYGSHDLRETIDSVITESGSVYKLAHSAKKD